MRISRGQRSREKSAKEGISNNLFKRDNIRTSDSTRTFDLLAIETITRTDAVHHKPFVKVLSQYPFAPPQASVWDDTGSEGTVALLSVGL